MDSAKKSDDIKSAKLSSTVLDYYTRYGQNRDLEKYLRLRRHSTSKSSSDSSLNLFEASNLASQNERIVKSMETLQVDDKKVKISDVIDKSASEPENKIENEKKTHVNDSPPPITVQNKSSRHERRKSKNKSYNLSLESNIEINLPTLATSLPSIPIVVEPPVETTSTVIPKALESVETQTLLTPLKQFLSKATETDAQVVSQEKCTTALAPFVDSPQSVAKIPTLNAETSPASSVASAKMRLEWDSLADVGYNKIIDFKSQSNRNLTTFERSALTKFFAEHGVRFDESLVIMASTEKPSPLQKRSFTQSAIEMHGAKRLSSDAKNETPTSSKYSWQKAIEKFRDKYGKPKANDSNMAVSGIDSTNFLSLSMPPHHSTPIAANLPRKDTAELREPVNEMSIESTNKNEKSCQTISKDMETVGVQVEKLVDVATAAIQTEYYHNTTEKSSIGVEADLTSATSFEFIAAKAYNDPSVGRIDSSTENVSHEQKCHTNSLDSDDNDMQTQQTPYGKENIPPVDEKENIPPLNDQSSRYYNQNNLIEPCSSNQLQSIVNEANISSLPVDLQKGVDLINVLMESRKMNRDTKKKCIRKIVKRLLESDNMHDISSMLMSFSDTSKSVKTASDRSTVDSDSSVLIKSSRPQMSGVSALSSSANSVTSSILRENSHKQKAQNAQAIADEKDWLQPITQSELEKEFSRRSHNQSEPAQSRPHEARDKRRVKSSNEILEFLKHEKETHFNWIDQEIQHLNNLKRLLKNMQVNESINITQSTLKSIDARQVDELLVIYENFKRNRNQTSENGSQADVSSAIQDSTASSIAHPKVRPERCPSNKTNWVHKSGRQSENSMDSVADRTSTTPKKSTQNLYDVADNAPEWYSHSNKHSIAKNRTKLDTPHSDESVECFARHRRAKFDQIRAKAQSSGMEKSTTAERSRPIYTKPYSTDSYSDVESLKPSSNERSKQMRNVDVGAYTSGSGMDGFLSSNSMSIAVAANSTSNTTTHQYDTKISVGSQTTDTLQRMRPVQLKKPFTPIVEEPEEASTVRVNKLTLNKQSQARPDALAYVIMFEETVKRKGNTVRRAATERGNKLYVENGKACNSRGHSSCNSSSSSSNSNSNSSSISEGIRSSDAIQQRYRNRDQRRSTHAQPSSRTSSTLSVEHFTLQEHLRLRRPDFYSSAEQRRTCVQNLHQLRQQRNEQRANLFAANGNAKTLNRNMKRLLPPPPLAQMRIFSSREIVQQTRQKYRELPEIRQQQQMERDRKIRRSHRIMMDIFNKKLQKNALRGKVNLSNSMTVVN